MKKILFLIVVLAVAAGAYFYFSKETAVSRQKAEPIVVNSNDSLSGSVGNALAAYFTLKDAFVKSDTTLVNNATLLFTSRMDSVKVKDINADTAIIELANNLKTTISVESKNIQSAAGLEAKRKAFQVVSDQLFDFVRSVGYNGSTIYQQYCPMAFNNSGAAWLSNTTEIVNPYYGDKMLHCGELRDSVSNKN